MHNLRDFSFIDDFKKMYKQKFKEREKAFAQQQKELKNLKAHGKSKAHAVSVYRERGREGGEGERGVGGRGREEKQNLKQVYLFRKLL